MPSTTETATEVLVSSDRSILPRLSPKAGESCEVLEFCNFEPEFGPDFCKNWTETMENRNLGRKWGKIEPKSSLKLIGFLWSNYAQK